MLTIHVNYYCTCSDGIMAEFIDTLVARASKSQKLVKLKLVSFIALFFLLEQNQLS